MTGQRLGKMASLILSVLLLPSKFLGLFPCILLILFAFALYLGEGWKGSEVFEI